MTATKNPKFKPKPAPTTLTGEEGFLWSRISAELDQESILALTPWSREKTLEMLADLEAKGAIEKILVAVKAEPLDEIDTVLALDDQNEELKCLDREFRREILVRYASSAETLASPYEVLEIHNKASASQIKEKYLRLSRKFHPDRFFKRDLGHYKRKLETIFSRIQKAYALLKEPIEREALDRTLQMNKKEKDPATPSAEARQNLRKKMSAINPELEKVGKAESLYKQGLEKQDRQDYLGAYEHFIEAIKLNSNREIYQKAYENIRPLVVKQKAATLIQDAREKYAMSGASREILKLTDEALRYEPQHPDAILLTAKVIVDLHIEKEMERARELLHKAKSYLPKEAEPHFVLAKLLFNWGDHKAAKKEAQEAVKKHPGHPGAKKIIEQCGK